MGGFQYITTNNFFPATVTASSAAVDAPVTALSDWANTRPLVRAWRSTSLDPQTLAFAFGSAKNGTWMALFHANFTQVQLAVSANGTTFTDLITGSSTFTTYTIPRDLKDPEGMYKLFVAQPYTGKTHGRIIIPAQATTGGEAYFQLGLAVWGNNITTMSHSFHIPFVEDYVDPEYKVEGADWEESFPAGIRYKTVTIRNTFRNTEAAEWHALRLLRPNARLLAYYNLDNPAEVELWVRNRPITITRQSTVQEVSTGFRSLT